MWKKLGRIFQPPGTGWMTSHAQNPFCEPLDDRGLFRVHFASRDERNRSRGGYFDFDIETPGKLLGLSKHPTLDLGELGAFDDSGVMPSSIVTIGRTRYMYYTGWQRAVDVPFLLGVGLAISRDGQRYRRHSRAPVLGRTPHDPLLTAAPWVVRDGRRFRMWYTSGTKWEVDGSGPPKPRHWYTVKHAESRDGVHWTTSPTLCLRYGAGEHALARPTVFKTGRTYLMRFSVRGGQEGYRIGLARSRDGVRWTRQRGHELEPSADGWDSEMTCYGSVFAHRDELYLLYNGNDYGRTGIGLAVWRSR